jgi:hypothetical protein
MALRAARGGHGLTQGRGQRAAKGRGPHGSQTASKVLAATAYLEPAQIQDLADLMPRLLEIKARSKVPIQFRVQVEVGDGKTTPPKEVAAQVTEVLTEIAGELQLR